MMIRIKNQREYEVWCKKCHHVLVFDSPEDLKKENKPNSCISPMFCLICPSCGGEIWFDGVLGFSLDPDFCEQVKFADKNLQKKFEDFSANLQADNFDLF